VIELLGIFLLAGTVTSVALINAVHRPFEIRSEDPHDFDITALEAYNRLLAALSTGKIKKHHLQLKETVDPLYFIAALSYADEIGNACEALVTLDVVEGYKSTTTIRWTCKFLKWCEKPTALAVRSLLDQWIIGCLDEQAASQISEAKANVTLLNELQDETQHPEEKSRPSIIDSGFPAISDPAREKTKSSPAEKVGSVSQKFQQKLRKPPPRISPLPQQFPLTLKKAYAKVNESLQEAPTANALWQVKEQIEEAYIIAQLNFGDDRSKPGDGSALVNVDFSETSSESTTITWSCEFKHWYDDSGVQDIQQFINTWLVETLSNPASAQITGTASATAANTRSVPAISSATGSETPPAIADSGSAIEIEQPPPPPLPVVKTVRSNYPKEFAYLKLMQRISSAPQKNTKWKLIECNQGNRIVARLTYASPYKPEAVCNVHSTLNFEGDASTGMVECIFVFSPESDAQVAQNFVEDTAKWMELGLR
jgi:hypothetical protein